MIVPEAAMWGRGMPGYAWGKGTGLPRSEEGRRAETSAEAGGAAPEPANRYPGAARELAGSDAAKGRGWRLPRRRLGRRAETAALVLVAVLGISATGAAVASRGSAGGTGQAAAGAAGQAGASGRGQAAAHARVSPAALAARGPVVVLGDSVAAGNLVPQSPVGTPASCLRSTHSYAADVAAAIHARTFIDVACSGATSANMTQPQKTSLGTNPPQFSGLARNDSIVMITVGGDDAGGYSHIMAVCTLLSFTGPSSDPCARHYRGSLAAAITADAPRIASVLRGIRARAPFARVLVVGYPDVFPNTGRGCWPAVPVASGDVAWLRGLEISLNRMLATEAAATGVTYVDTYTATIGHDVCQPEKVRDVEGLFPGSLTEPGHPNARGHRVMAAQVLRALG